MPNLLCLLGKVNFGEKKKNIRFFHFYNEKCKNVTSFYLEAWVDRHKVPQLIIIIVGVGLLTAGFRQEIAVVRLQIFIISQITEKTRLLLQLLLHDDARGCEAVDGQPVGHLVEADAVEEIVLTVDVKFSSFGTERSPTGAGGRGRVELSGWRPDQSIE